MAEQQKKPTPQQRSQKRIQNKIEGTVQLAEILTGKRPLPGKFRGKYKPKQTFRKWADEVETGFKGKPTIDKSGAYPGMKINIRRIGIDGPSKATGK